MKQKTDIAKEEVQQLSAKLKHAESANKEIETENNNLRAKQLEHNTTVTELKQADAEIGE